MRRSRPMSAPIVSNKHQRAEDLSYIGAFGNNNYMVYQGTAVNVATQVGDIPNGQKVYSIDVSLTFIHQSGSGSGRISWMLVHLRDGQTIGNLFASNDASNWSNIGLSKGKNQVIKSYMSAIGTEDAGARQWIVHIKIPKMWHRVREGDSLVILFNGDQAGLLSTGTRFKSYS